MQITAARYTDDNGRVHDLVYDTDDVADQIIEAPFDVVDVTPPGTTAIKRELGAAHLNLRIAFKPGTGPSWVPIEADKEV